MSRNSWLFLAVVLCSCVSSEKRQEIVKLNQYMVEGMTLYRNHCANCHQVNGEGLARVIPPLKDADYLKKMSGAELACAIQKGMEGTIFVNEIMYNQKMPAVSSLTALEVAELVTYVDNTWGSESGIYEVIVAQKELENCR